MIFSWSPLKIPLLHVEIMAKTKLYSWKFCKIVLHSLIIPGNCSSFSVDPYNFNMIFLQYPRKFHVLNPRSFPPRTCLDFSLYIYLSIYTYIYTYIYCTLFDHFEERVILKGGPWLPDLLLSQFRFFFVVFQDRLQYWLIMAFYVLQHGWYKQNNWVAALFNMLATSWSYENICFDQNYQPGKITF